MYSFAQTLHRAYRYLPLKPAGDITHFRIEVRSRPRYKSLWRSQVDFVSDGLTPFEPYPNDHAFPMFEWGLNWCIATTAHQYLLLHCATAARGEKTLIMPAMPGSGKSTLCTSLMDAGWRLLSDEFGILDLEQHVMRPMPRPIPLKNNSIDVISQQSASIELGPRYEKTRKGTVAHAFPTIMSLQQQHLTSNPGAIVFPRYKEGVGLSLRAQQPHIVATRLVNNAFNYLVTGHAGFTAMTKLVNELPAFDLVYSDTDQALDALAEVIDNS